jgi:hypothetical protein
MILEKLSYELLKSEITSQNKLERSKCVYYQCGLGLIFDRTFISRYHGVMKHAVVVGTQKPKNNYICSCCMDPKIQKLFIYLKIFPRLLVFFAPAAVVEKWRRWLAFERTTVWRSRWLLGLIFHSFQGRYGLQLHLETVPIWIVCLFLEIMATDESEHTGMIDNQKSRSHSFGSWPLSRDPDKQIL